MMSSRRPAFHIARVGDTPAQPLGTAGTQKVLLGEPCNDHSPLLMGITQVEPGRATELIRHDTAEIGYVIAGAGWMIADDDDQPVQTGDAVLIAARRWHAIKAAASGLEMLYIFPSPGHPYTVAYLGRREQVLKDGGYPPT